MATIPACDFSASANKLGDSRMAIYGRRLSFGIAIIALAAVIASPAAAALVPLRLAQVAYDDPLLSRVTIRWRCDQVPGGDIVYRGYIDAAPHGTSATIVEGLIWLADSGLTGKGEAVTLRQMDGRFSAAAWVPKGSAGTFNLMPFRILVNGKSCGSPVSIYWWPVDEAKLPSLARSSHLRFPVDRAHEFALR
jgi:hypothetical protein